MPRKSLEERAVAAALAFVPSPTTLAPDPGFGASHAPTSPKTALRRCCAAWQRAYDAYMAAHAGKSCNEIFAADPAGVAYRNAMPVLAGHEGLRDFIACAAHGILIGAIPRENSGQLLYAAQVALASLRHQPKTAQIHSSTAPSPTPPPTRSPSFEAMFPLETSTE